MRLVPLAVASVLVLGSAAVHSGCGTVLGHAGIQILNVELNPDDPNASIRVNGKEVRKGKGEVEIDARRESNTIEVTTPDGRIGKGTVTREVMPFVVVADACMLIFPIYIDYLNGGMYKMPKEMTINLGKPPEQRPDPTPPDPVIRTNQTSPTVGEQNKPCAFCGEPRPVSAQSCPHCGQK